MQFSCLPIYACFIPLCCLANTPCLNESATLPSCISRAKWLLEQNKIKGEIIVADNGSTDDSVKIALDAGARLVEAKAKGYGAALHAGVLAAESDFVIFADGDDSYYFDEASAFIQAFDNGAELVIGNRFQGGIEKNAMPFLHRYFGTPVISFLGRRSFHVSLGDFNCGMRGVKKDSYEKLQMKSTGMEYATELIAKASYKKMNIEEVPVRLYRDGRGRKPHLKTWSDGWKHLKLILLLSPKWLLLYPAIFFLLTGSLLGISILSTQVKIFNVRLDIHTLYFCSVFGILSITFLEFYYMVNYYGMSIGVYPRQGISHWISEHLNFEKGIIWGIFLFLAGTLISAAAVFRWYEVSFKELNPEKIFRIIIPGGFCMIAGLQFIVFSFFITLIKNNSSLSS